MIDLLELKEWHESQRRPGGRPQGELKSSSPFEPSVQPTTDESQLKPFGNEYIPTPETIRRRCLEIQAEWSNAERRRRSVGDPRPEETIRVHRLWAPHSESAESA